MANRRIELETVLKATDDASKVIEGVQQNVDKLEGTTAQVAVEADDQATDVIAGAQGAVDELDGADATVAVEADDEATEPLEGVQGAVDGLDGAAATVTADADDEATGTLDDVAGAVGDLDGSSAEVAVDADDEASDVLDDVQSAIEDLDGTDATVTAEVDDQASGAIEDIGSSLGGLTTQLGALPGPIGELSGLLSSMGTGAGAGLAAAGAGVGLIAAAVGSSISAFQELNIAIADFVTATGTSFDEASRIIEVAGDIGIPIDTVEKSISKMNLAAGKTPAAFDEIGASVVRNKDGAIDVSETFLGVVAALGQIDDAQLRAQKGREIFGNGWRALAPLISESAEQVRASLAAVGDEKIGSEEKAAEAKALREAFDTVNDAVDKVKNSLAEALAPALADMATAVGGAVDAVAPLAEEIGTELADALIVVTPLIQLATDTLGKLSTVDIKLPGDYEFHPFTGGIAQGTEAWNALRKSLGDTPKLSGDLVIDTKAVATEQAKAAAAADDHAKSLEAQRKANDAAAASLEKFTHDLAMHVVAVGEAGVKMGELGGALDQIDLRQDALSQVFKLDDGPTKAAGQVRDIALEIDGLSEAAKGVKVGDVLANDVKADKFLDAIDKLKPQIQSAITTAFGAGGPEAATAMANSYIDQVTAELGGKFTREQVAEMLGLSNISATIAVAVEKSDIESAKRQLALLVGVGGQTPYTATIAMALDAGTITGKQAQTLIQSKLGDAGVEIPASLAQPQTADAIAGAQAALDAGEPVALPSKVDTTDAKKDVDKFVGDDHGTVVLPSEADSAKLAATDRAIDAVATQERTALLMSQAEAGTLGVTDAKLDAVATQQRTALLMSEAEAGTLSTTDARLEGVKDKDRTAVIGSRADSGDLNATGRALDDVANKRRTATIFVQTSGAGYMLGGSISGGAKPIQGMVPTATDEEAVLAPNGRMRVTRRSATRRQPVTNVTNVTNNVIVPRIPSGRELERVSARWSRVNGRT